MHKIRIKFHKVMLKFYAGVQDLGSEGTLEHANWLYDHDISPDELG